jgi:hypothetical protein
LLLELLEARKRVFGDRCGPGGMLPRAAMTDESRLEERAPQVADGEPVDWEVEERRSAAASP